MTKVFPRPSTETKQQTPARYLCDFLKSPDILPGQWYERNITTSSLFRIRHVSLGKGLGGLTVSYGPGTNMSFHAHDTLAQLSNPSPSEVESTYGTKLA
jgi:hypothetical protein